MIIYELTKTNHNNILGNYRSFGIKAFDSSCSEKYINIEDIFTDLETAKEYVELFNNEQLDITHVEEALEDILHYI